VPTRPAATQAPATQAPATQTPAKQVIAKQTPVKPPVAEPAKPKVAQAPTRPAVKPAQPAGAGIPNYDYWAKRLQGRPLPANAATLAPVIRRSFTTERTPTEMLWLAEVESTFNPSARSPVGAMGLFQLMPATAQSLGLSTWMPDERTVPDKSAGAAARYLRSLYVKFGDWPLALAAYNAGEGRVRRTLQAQKAKGFAEISTSLPVETRLYVPKVLAMVALRTGVPPERIAAPGP
jgi:membrane-bound lytic murein transglycosylase D